MKTGIAFAAIPKLRSSLTSTLGMSGIAATAGTVILLDTVGWVALAATAATTVATTSFVSITASRHRIKLQQTGINAVLEDVIHCDFRISPAQTRRLLRGGKVVFKQGEAEMVEISYLENSGEPTEKPGVEVPYTGLISIECVRDSMDAVKSFDSILLSLCEQESAKVLNHDQVRKVYSTIKTNRAIRASESRKKEAA